MRARVHPTFAPAFDIHDSEKNCILRNRSEGDVPEITAAKQPVDRAKSFMFSFQDFCLQVLGNAGKSLGAEYYQMPGLADMLVSSVLAGLDQLPDYRLYPVLRIFVRPFVQWCPGELQAAVVMPLLRPILPLMFQKLNTKWDNFRLKYGNSVDYETEMTEEQELLDDQLHRTLSREYLALLATILLTRPKQQQDSAVEGAGGDDEQEEKPVDPSATVISPFGTTVLRAEELCSPIVLTVFNALHWSDTMASFKALTLSTPLLKHVSALRSAPST